MQSHTCRPRGQPPCKLAQTLHAFLSNHITLKPVPQSQQCNLQGSWRGPGWLAPSVPRNLGSSAGLGLRAGAAWPIQPKLENPKPTNL